MDSAFGAVPGARAAVSPPLLPFANNKGHLYLKIFKNKINKGCPSAWSVEQGTENFISGPDGAPLPSTFSSRVC